MSRAVRPTRQLLSRLSGAISPVVIPIKGEEIEILHTPPSFYDALLTGIKQAKRDVVLAALYLSRGEKEKELLETISGALRKNSDLHVTFLLDHSRTTRGGEEHSSVSMLSPLVQEFGGQRGKARAHVYLYQMPQLQGSFARHIPSPFNETVAVSHLKFFTFDDDTILSGANLSQCYFVDRQDRYMKFRNCSTLANHYRSMAAALAPSSWTPCKHGSFGLTPPLWLNNSEAAMRAYVDVKEKLEILFTGNKRDIGSKNIARDRLCVDSSHDTVIIPTLQHNTLGIRTDDIAMSELLDAGSEPGWRTAMSTAYLNLPPHYLKHFQHRSRDSAEVLSAGAISHGFAGASGAASLLSPLYARLHARAVRAGVPLTEYSREGYTYHAKGLWMWAPPHGSNSSGESSENFPENSEKGPCVTVVGSSNFGCRSVYRDLESQVVLLTENENLQRRLGAEWEALRRYAAPVQQHNDGGKVYDRIGERWLRGALTYF